MGSGLENRKQVILTCVGGFDTLFHSIDYTKALTISNVTLSSFFLFSIFFFLGEGDFFFAVSESLNRQCSEESIGKWRRAAYRSEI